MTLSFSDFWGDFDYNNNFFYDIIKQINPEVRIVGFNEQPDILIYSCFGYQHTLTNRLKTKKIYYTGENIRPNFAECDYSLSFDFDTYNNKNFRLPLWMLQIDWFNKRGYTNPEFVLPYDDLLTNKFIDTPKTKFCCAIFNTDSPHRFKTVDKLSNYKKVDCYGKPHGNWFYGESTKYKILSEYKFSICFENSIYPGYYTEKLFHAKTSGTVPIYWSDPSVENDFNKKSFINLYDFDSDIEELIKFIKVVDRDNDLYKAYITEPLYTKLPSLDNIKLFLHNVIK